jgi:hypothetical protein
MGSVMRCCICGTDLRSSPAIVDKSTNTVFCQEHASLWSGRMTATDLSVCGQCGFKYAKPQATFETGSKANCPNCGLPLGDLEAETELLIRESAAIRAVEEWMDQAPVGAPDKLLSELDRWARDFKTDWGTGSKSVVVDVLARCVTHDHASGTTAVGFMGVAPNQRLGDYPVEHHEWDDDAGGGSFLRFIAGPSFHLVAKLAQDRFALLVHSGGDGIQELAAKDQGEALDAADARWVERGEYVAYTYAKEALQKYGGGSLEKFGRFNGARKIYESDVGFHIVLFGAREEELILRNASLTNLRLVWQR